MGKYNTSDIRNVVILGGSGSGKTTLVEAAAFVTAKTNRLGSVHAGNTLSDYDQEEKKRGFSIHTSLIPLEYHGYKVNMLDTPGGLDFSGERDMALSVADLAVIVINGRRGVDSGVLFAWNLCNEYHLPRLCYVTGMDEDSVSFHTVIEQLKVRYGNRIAPFYMPVRKEQRLIGYVDITTGKATAYDGIGHYVPIEVPEYCKQYLSEYKQVLDEAVASVSEENMDKFFNGEQFSAEEVEQALRSNCIDGSIVPVLMGSGLHVLSVDNLLDVIVRYFPEPSVTKTGISGADHHEYSCSYEKEKPLVAQVFKTISDPYTGRYSYIKVYSGTLHTDMNVYLSSNETQIKIGRIYTVCGSEFLPTDEIVAGDIGAVPRLTDVATGDTISTRATPVILPTIEFEKPYTRKRYETVDKKDDDKVYGALLKLMEEDKTINICNDAENGQQLLVGIGEQQLDILTANLQNKYKIGLQLESPRIPYRETICKSAEAKGRFKKQSGGHGQFGDVLMSIEPSGQKEVPYQFEQRIVGGAVPKNYFPAVEKGVEESVRKGFLAGYPVVGIKAVLLDGSYHPVDSCENAFRMASVFAFKEAYKNAEPILLEPIASAQITAMNEFTGDVISDLKTRRARVMGMNPLEDGKSCILADIPMAELDGYLTRLRSLCGGYVSLSYEFSRYGRAPEQITDKLVEEYNNS